ncbi:MAG: DUF4236 domain-containing protein [Kiritimatiellia bacterium]
MGFRFQRRITILPGISINFGKRGASVSVGPRGCKTTLGARGVKHSFGIPGTGIRYETPYRKWGKGRNPADSGSCNPRPGEPAQGSLWARIRNLFGF